MTPEQSRQLKELAEQFVKQKNDNNGGYYLDAWYEGRIDGLIEALNIIDPSLAEHVLELKN